MRKRFRKNVDDKIDYYKWIKENVDEVSEPDANGEVKMKCPFCQHDEFRFNVRTGQFKCFRENNCGRVGNAQILILEKGFTPITYFSGTPKITSNKGINLDGNDVEPLFVGDKINSELPKWTKKFLEERKFTKEAVNSAKVYYDGKDDTIVFPRITREGIVLGAKRRHSPKSKVKFTQEKNSGATFFNAHSFKSEVMYIAEGETDTLSLMSLGFIDSAVGIPAGANGSCQEWLAENYELFSKVKKIILCLDNDPAGAKTIKSFVKEYNGMAEIQTLSLGDSKDISEIYMRNPNELMQILSNPVSVYSGTTVKLLDEIDDDNVTVPINFRSFETLLGGFRLGELTILLGRASTGKTSYAYQLVTAVADSKVPTMIYSGEMKLSKTRNWLLSKFARKTMLISKRNKYNPDYIDVRLEDSVSDFLREFYNDYIECYDNSSWKSEDLIKDIIFQARTGKKFILLDNLSVVDVGEDEVFGMKEFITKLRNIAVLFDVHLLVVSHPRKTISEGSSLGLDDAYGSGAIGKLAFNFLTLSRSKEENDITELKVVKCREYGVSVNDTLKMKYDRTTLRMYCADNGDRPTEKDRVFLWEKVLPMDIKEKFRRRDE